MTNQIEPAFPFVYTPDVQVCEGLSKREYFAAMAMKGLAALSYNTSYDSWRFTPEGIADNAVLYADALIEALNK